MFIRIDPQSGVPIWQQVAEQIRRQAAAGELRSGDKLPTVRELAGTLRINPNTVARVYQELERQGVVESRRGLGTFLAALPPPADVPEATGRLLDKIDAAIVEAIHGGVNPYRLHSLLDERIAVIRPPRGPVRKDDTSDGESS